MRGLLGIWLSLLVMPAMAVEVDGRIDPQEWAGAQHVDDFRMTQPLTRLPGSQPTEAWILATPEGLAIGFRMAQPAGVPRTRQRVQRDFDAQVDRVNLNVDFDGDGRTGYNFTLSSTDGIADAVISNENSFNNDWDGNWKHAVSEDAKGWSAEMLIPWYIAPMRKAQGDRRRLKINLDRVIGSTGERSAWPAASFERPRFLSDFAVVEVAQYSQSLLTVTPYVSGLYDSVHGGSDFDGGADLGDWVHEVEMQLSSGGLAGNSRVGYSIQYTPTYFISDAFSLTAGIHADHTPDWLVWDRERNLLGSFDGREVQLNAGLDWAISDKQELRVKLQAIGVDADLRQTYVVDSAGNPVVSAVQVDDFNVTNLGFQIRYRYELAPLSYLYVVYGRGGYNKDSSSEDTGRLLGDSFDLRDDEQLLVKLSYRFEL